MTPFCPLFYCNRSKSQKNIEKNTIYAILKTESLNHVLIFQKGGHFMGKFAAISKFAKTIGARFWKHPIKNSVKGAGTVAAGDAIVHLARPFHKAVKNGTELIDNRLNGPNDHSADIAGAVGGVTAFAAGYGILNHIFSTKEEREGKTTWFTPIKRCVAFGIGGVLGWLSFGKSKEIWANMQTEQASQRSETQTVIRPTTPATSSPTQLPASAESSLDAVSNTPNATRTTPDKQNAGS